MIEMCIMEYIDEIKENLNLAFPILHENLAMHLCVQKHTYKKNLSRSKEEKMVILLLLYLLNSIFSGKEKLKTNILLCMKFVKKNT